MKKLLSCIFLFLTSLCIAQVDSLKERLSQTTGEEKLKVLNRLTALDSTPAYFSYHKEAMALAKKMNDPSGEVRALRAIGDHHKDWELEDSALFYYNKSLNVARTHKLQREIIKSLDRLAYAKDIFGHYDEALLLYKEAVAESRKLNNKKEVALALEQLAVFHKYYRNDSLALKYFNEQLGITKEIKDSVMMSHCLNNIGIVYYSRREFDNCIQYYKSSLAIEQRLHKDSAIATSRLNIGMIYKDQGNYVTALTYLLDALRYLVRLQPSKDLGSCYNSLGGVYMELHENDKALFYHHMALDVRQKINNKRGIAISYNNIGETYKAQGKYELALRSLKQAIKLKEKLGDKGSMAVSISLVGEIYFLKNDFPKAETYYLQALELLQEAEDPKEKATTLNKLGALYVAWGKYALAGEKLDEARTIAKSKGVKKVLQDNYKITISLLEATGDYKTLAYYCVELLELNDDILNAEKNKALIDMEIKYKTEEKDCQIELMNKTDKLNAARLSQQKTLIYSLAGGLVLLIVIVFVSIKAYRSGVKSNKQSQVIIAQKQMLIDQEQMMMKELHHRVKNNLQLLASLLQLQHKRLEDPATKEAIKAVEHRLNAMLLIHRDLYGKGAGSEVDLKIYIKKMIDNLLFSFGNPEVKVELDLPADALYVDAGKALNIGFIFNEAINNAFKHAFTDTEMPKLAIAVRKKENDHLLFSIGDNGKGMPVENNPEAAASFGLGLIHLLVKEMEGNLTIASDKKGSRLEFSIPINKNIA